MSTQKLIFPDGFIYDKNNEHIEPKRVNQFWINVKTWGIKSKFLSLPPNYIIMETNGYRLLLPEGTLDYFDIVDVKESGSEVVIYLEEKNVVPLEYAGKETESKGF